MYAIIRSGGKQYKVKAGDTLRVEKLEKELGSEFDLDEVLVVSGDKTYVGEPTVQGAKVTVVVTRQTKAPKVIVFKKKCRQGYRRMRGRRQPFTELFVKSITNPEGQSTQADGQAQVFSPEKKAAKVEKAKEVRQTKKESGPKRKEVKATKKTAASAGPAKKTAAKKVAKKKKAAKKTAKKKAAKKKSAAKKKTTTTKKTAKKKTTKKKS